MFLRTSLASRKQINEKMVHRDAKPQTAKLSMYATYMLNKNYRLGQMLKASIGPSLSICCSIGILKVLMKAEPNASLLGSQSLNAMVTSTGHY
jgi:hypothetical protein